MKTLFIAPYEAYCQAVRRWLPHRQSLFHFVRLSG
jgi:protein-S-isoprenylcysteine O-methyltransferase Ste14